MKNYRYKLKGPKKEDVYENSIVSMQYGDVNKFPYEKDE